VSAESVASRPTALLPRHPLVDTPADVLIYGAGDLGHSVRRIFQVQGVAVRGFVDDGRPVGAEFHGLRVLGRGDDAARLCSDDPTLRVAPAIGYRRFDLRAARFEALQGAGIHFCRCMHPSAVVDPTAVVGQGVVAFAGSVVDHGCVLEDDVLLNTGSLVAHDTTIQRHAFLSPGATLAGFVTVGRCAWIGLGARILEHVRIGDGAVVAAGAVVRHDVTPFSLVAGVPAVVKKTLPAFNVGSR
jgi:sugar O-acyltransferase (sialic acid O-acetyltransferase NeuD family)